MIVIEYMNVLRLQGFKKNKTNVYILINNNICVYAFLIIIYTYLHHILGKSVIKLNQINKQYQLWLRIRKVVVVIRRWLVST